MVALLDARRDEVYAGLFPGAAEAFPEGVYSAGEIAGHLPQECVLVGSGAEVHAGLLGESDGRELIPGVEPRARSVGALGMEVLDRGEGVLAADLQPRYLRRSDAEVKRGAAPPA